MILILARLQWLTLKGRVVRSIRLLRQPKYLVGAVVGVGWMGVWVLRPLLASHARFGSVTSSMPFTELMPAFHRLAALAATIFLPLPWLFPWGWSGLPFREAELTMLLQAPLTRRQVIHYGLLKSEIGVVVSSLIASLLLNGRGFSSSWPMTFIGTWLAFEFLHLNGKWRALFVNFGSRGRRLGLTNAMLLFYAALFAVLVPFLAQTVAGWRGMDRAQVTAAVSALEWPPLVAWLTTPGFWLTAPVFAAGVRASALAFLPLAIGIIVQREIVLRSKARFEESALEHAKSKELRGSPARRSARHHAWTRASRPFELTPEGRPDVAVVWKNAMRVSRVSWRVTAGLGAAFLAAIVALPAVLRLPDFTYGLLAVFGGVLAVVQPIVGGMAWNNDLRSELGHIEAVRTWPVAAHRFLLAEVVSSSLMSFAASIFGAGVVLTSLFGSRLRELLTGQPTELHLLPRTSELLGVHNTWAAVLIFIGLVPLAAAACFFSSALQNLAVLIMPAWMAQTVDRSRGVAAFGQRMLSSFAFGLTFAISLIPSALLVGIALYAQHRLGIPWSAWAFPLWGALAAAPPLFMAWLLLRFAAPLWERLDPSEELLEIGR